MAPVKNDGRRHALVIQLRCHVGHAEVMTAQAHSHRAGPWGEVHAVEVPEKSGVRPCLNRDQGTVGVAGDGIDIPASESSITGAHTLHRRRGEGDRRPRQGSPPSTSWRPSRKSTRSPTSSPPSAPRPGSGPRMCCSGSPNATPASTASGSSAISRSSWRASTQSRTRATAAWSSTVRRSSTPSLDATRRRGSREGSGSSPSPPPCPTSLGVTCAMPVEGGEGGCFHGRPGNGKQAVRLPFPTSLPLSCRTRDGAPAEREDEPCLLLPASLG